MKNEIKKALLTTSCFMKTSACRRNFYRNLQVYSSHEPL